MNTLPCIIFLVVHVRDTVPENYWNAYESWRYVKLSDIHQSVYFLHENSQKSSTFETLKKLKIFYSKSETRFLQKNCCYQLLHMAIQHVIIILPLYQDKRWDLVVIFSKVMPVFRPHLMFKLWYNKRLQVQSTLIQLNFPKHILIKESIVIFIAYLNFNHCMFTFMLPSTHFLDWTNHFLNQNLHITDRLF